MTDKLKGAGKKCRKRMLIPIVAYLTAILSRSHSVSVMTAIMFDEGLFMFAVFVGMFFEDCKYRELCAIGTKIFCKIIERRLTKFRTVVYNI